MIKTKIRRVPGVMNNLEKAFYEEVLLPMKTNGSALEVWFEEITLKLAPNTRYTPDFAVQTNDDELVFYETKGFMRDDANVKIKVAASKFPFRLFLCQKRAKKDGGGWQMEEIRRNGPQEVQL
jgi:hypothetical protein